MLKAISIISLALVILFSYQNCAVYQSDGRAELNRILGGVSNGCLPYLDINIATGLTGISTSDISLSQIGSSSVYFGCLITNRGAGGGDRAQFSCEVSENAKNKVDQSHAGTGSYDSIYNNYCTLNNQASTPFVCESTTNIDRVPLIQNLLPDSVTQQESFLAYFKLNGDPSIAGFNGFGYAEYFNSEVQVRVLVADDDRGIECSVSFGKNGSSDREADYNNIMNATTSSDNDIEKLKGLAIEILSHY